MKYSREREQRIQVFENTIDACEREHELWSSVRYTQQHTCIYRNPEQELAIQQPAFGEGNITVTDNRTLQAAARWHACRPESRIGILNFASATNPGGGVVRGSNAQEECLCRCSTLYPCLHTEPLWQEYYQFHQQREDVFYTDTCIYTPDVVILKKDISPEEWLPKEEWFMADVLSCAAPNMRLWRQWNPSASEPAPTELQHLLEQRVGGICHVAAAMGISILVLGAFGCGAFGNSPEMVAGAFCKALERYASYFQEVEFAVYCEPRHRENYNAFCRQFV